MAMSPPDEYPIFNLSKSMTFTPSFTSSETYLVPGVVVIERFFTVPLDYNDLSRGTIQLFARHCVALTRQKQMDTLPFLVYLQGGSFPILWC